MWKHAKTSRGRRSEEERIVTVPTVDFDKTRGSGNKGTTGSQSVGELWGY